MKKILNGKSKQAKLLTNFACFVVPLNIILILIAHYHRAESMLSLHQFHVFIKPPCHFISSFWVFYLMSFLSF